jgi:hypothetical protein
MLSARAAKAYVAGAIAGLAAAAPAVDAGLDAGELMVAAGAFLVAFQAVYWTSNAPAQDEPADEFRHTADLTE